jgi:hypothetical protein
MEDRFDAVPPFDAFETPSQGTEFQHRRAAVAVTRPRNRSIEALAHIRANEDDLSSLTLGNPACPAAFIWYTAAKARRESFRTILIKGATR